jgi:hypothetical protein
MVLSKTKFFVLLFVLFVFPFVVYKLLWIAGSKQTMGEMRFLGRTLDTQGSSDHPVFRFSSNGKDTIFFNGKFDLGYKVGEIVSVRFQKDNPTDAKVNSFAGLWLDTFFCIIPQLLILSILFLTPDKWEPFVPSNAKIILAKRPLIRIVPEENPLENY